MPKIPSLEELRGNIDYAHRQTLKSYNDGRFWWLITSPTLGIEDFAWCCLQTATVENAYKLVFSGQVVPYRSINDLPGADFLCLYFEDAYFLKPYPFPPTKQFNIWRLSECRVWEVSYQTLSLERAIALCTELNSLLTGEKPTRSPLHSLFPDSMLPIHSF